MSQPDGTIKYQLRSQADSTPVEMLNLVEKEAFLNGDKVRPSITFCSRLLRSLSQSLQFYTVSAAHMFGA